MSIFNTLFIGKVSQHFPELASTNDFAIDLLAKSRPIEGTVISADYQTVGKGQLGSNWHSTSGQNLLLSIILFPKWLLIENQFSYSQAMALGVADAVSQLINIKATVKWPNDIYVENKKVAGILIQNGLVSNGISWSVVGIGLNVNEEKFPDHLPKASSLKTYNGGVNYRLEDVQHQLYKCIEQRYLQLKFNPKEISSQYLQHLFQYQSWENYQDTKTEEVFRGQIIGVHKNGKLAMQKEGSIHTIDYFDLKEIIFL